jgi:hypothetical protein
MNRYEQEQENEPNFLQDMNMTDEKEVRKSKTKVEIAILPKRKKGKIKVGELRGENPRIAKERSDAKHKDSESEH